MADVFDFSHMKQEMEKIPEKVLKVSIAYMDTEAQRLKRKAQEERPWTDRTGHARQRLRGYVEPGEHYIRLYLQHGVDYGASLEYGHDKRYAIIHPILRREGPRVLKGICDALKKA